MSLNVVDLYSVDNCVGWIEHFVVVATEVALGVYCISFQLLAVVTEVEMVIIETILRQFFFVAICIKEVDKILCI